MKSFFIENKYAILLVISIVLLLIFVITKYKKWAITVVARILVGSVLILIINGVFAFFSLSFHAGINPCTISILGLLGLPGLMLIYGSILFFTIF